MAGPFQPNSSPLRLRIRKQLPYEMMRMNELCLKDIWNYQLVINPIVDRSLLVVGWW